MGRLLIDPGVTFSKLCKALGHNFNGIQGCLVSHDHKDHCKAADDVAEYGIDLFDFSNLRMKQINQVGSFDVIPFPTIHIDRSMGFIVRQGTEALLFVTDTKNITQRFNVQFTTIAIECSYDRVKADALFAAGKINKFYREQRLTQHLEINDTKRYLREFCDLSQCRELHLLHMSKTLGDKESVRQEFETEFLINTFIAGV